MADDVYGFSEGDSKRISRTVRRVERSVDAGGGIPPQQSYGGGARIYEGYLEEDLPAPVYKSLPSGDQALRASTAMAKPWKKLMDDPDDPDAPPIFGPSGSAKKLINRDPTLAGTKGAYVQWSKTNGENRPLWIGCDPTNEVQRIEITGDPTGGTFTLRYESEETAAIDHDATAADVQSALEALEAIGAGNVEATDGPLPSATVDVEFKGDLADKNVALMSADSNGLTGGTAPNVTVTPITEGCCS